MASIPPPTKKSGKGAPPPMNKTVGNLDKTEPTRLTPLNFKVPAEFHREYKLYAASHEMTMLELLFEGFELVKQQKGQ